MLAFIIGLECSNVDVEVLINKKQIYKVNRVNLYDLESGDKFDLGLYETIKLKDKIIGTEKLEMIERDYPYDSVWDNVYLSSKFERFVVLSDNKEPGLYGVYANLKITLDGKDNYIGNGIVGGSAFRHGETPASLDIIYDTKNDKFDVYFNNYSINTKKHRSSLFLYGNYGELVDYLVKFHEYCSTQYYCLLKGCLEYKKAAKSLESLIIPDGCWYVKLPYDLKNSDIKNIVFSKTVHIIDFRNSYTTVIDNVTFYLSKKTNINIIKQLVLSCIYEYAIKHTDCYSDSNRERAKLLLEFYENVKVRSTEGKINRDKEYLISEAYRVGINIKLY